MGALTPHQLIGSALSLGLSQNKAAKLDRKIGGNFYVSSRSEICMLTGTDGREIRPEIFDLLAIVINFCLAPLFSPGYTVCTAAYKRISCLNVGPENLCKFQFIGVQLTSPATPQHLPVSGELTPLFCVISCAIHLLISGIFRLGQYIVE
jgi:hypothetical protein